MVDVPVVPVAPPVAPETVVLVVPDPVVKVTPWAAEAAVITVLMAASEFDQVKVAPLSGLVMSPGRSDIAFVPHVGVFVGLYKVPVPRGASKPRSAIQSTELRLGPQDDQIDELFVSMLMPSSVGSESGQISNMLRDC